MSASTYHPVPVPPDLKVAAAPKVPDPRAEAAALVRCSHAHLCKVIQHKVPGVPHPPECRIGLRRSHER